MEIHRQQCQKCRSFELRNLLVRDRGRPQMVFVRCGGCGELVARYQLSAYYHHGKDFESYLRSQQWGAQESSRDMMDDYEQTQNEAVELYEQVLKWLAEQGKQI